MNMARLGFVMLLGFAIATVAAARQSAQAQPPAQSSSSQTAQSNPQTSQESPLAAAARRAREEKKEQPQTKTPRVWDNDNIPSIPSNLNVVGSSDSAGASAAQASDQGNAPAEPVDKDAVGKDLAAAKDHLQTLQTDLDLLQRTFTLDQQSYYGKPDYASDADGAAKLKGEQTSIDAKQQEIEDAQKKIGDLQAQFNTASAPKPASSTGGTSGGGTDTNPPASTPPPSSN
ncbi:MAG: hypothetical protein ACRD5R_13830 [Candidatus Acidiferrales bacterium]